MSAILAMVTGLILVLLSAFRKRTTKVLEPVLVSRRVHPGHLWVRPNEDGHLLVGMDDFAQSVIGRLDVVRLPRLLKSVHQGEPVLEVIHGKRTVSLVSPVSGRVVEKNQMVLDEPSLVNGSPYGDGWLFKVYSPKAERHLRNLLTGRLAQDWQEMARIHLHRMFAGTPALVIQDGGVIIDDLCDRCSDEEWQGIQSEFFLTKSPTKL
jgi:glycine cleavage system H protein